MADDFPADETLHERALRHANEAWEAEADNFDAGRDDQRFYAGEQWLPEAKRERDAANRPVITINRIPSFVRQVTNDIRRDTPTIKVAPAKDGASQDVAEIFNGLIRNIEIESNAKAAYVQAAENACIVGKGDFRIRTRYSDNDPFLQDLRIERITDPFSVLYDPSCKEADKSDARYVLFFVDKPKEQFTKEFPGKVAEDVPSGPNGGVGMAWFSAEAVRIAEYWYREPVKKTLLLLADGRVLSAEQALKETESGQALDVLEKRTVDSFRVRMCLISGKEILSKEHDWPGRYIPFCPAIGEEIWIEGRCIRKGLVRDAKDPQRVYNYMRTAAVEAAALQPKAPWVVTVDMVKGNEKYWNTAGSKNHPYLPYTPDRNAANAKPERAQPALAQNGLDSQSLLAADDMKAVTGIYDASLGAKSNETSGRAILARQREGDTGTYHFIENLGTAIRCAGRILVDVIPKIYDTERVVRVLKEDGTHEMAKINAVDEAGQKFNDLSVGEYDVTVIVGPSFATRRQEAAESMTELVRAAPNVMVAAADLIVRNMDFPGAEEVAKRLERMVPPQLKDDQPQGPPPPDPAMVADALKKGAETDKIRAESEGKEIENATKLLELQALVAGIPQALAGMQQMLQQVLSLNDKGQGGQSPQGAPAGSPAPQDAMPMAEGGMPPMGEMPDAGMVELEPLQVEGPMA